jgi:hypothetical protein
MHSFDKFLVLTIIIYFVLTIYWQPYATEPHSDGAAYLDIARNIVKRGVFSSNQMFLEGDWRGTVWKIGLEPSIHSIGYFVFAIFFIIGDVSLCTAQIAIIFQGFLIILVVYELTRRLFNLNIARLSTFIIAVHPEFITHVVLVGGPEIPSALFLIFAIYLILLSVEEQENQINHSVLAALSSFLAWFAWYFNFFVFLTQLPLIFLYLKSGKLGINIKDVIKELGLLILALFYFVIDYRILGNLSYAFFGIAFPFSIVILLFILSTNIFKKISNELKVFVILVFTVLVIYSGYRIIFQLDPQVRIHVESFVSPQQFVYANIEKDKNILFSRIINSSIASEYWKMYYEGTRRYFGSLFILLSILSLVRIQYTNKILLTWSFPALQILWWVYFVQIDAFQGRFVICSFIFYSILVAVLVECLLPSHKKLFINNFIKIKINKTIIIKILVRRNLLKFICFIIVTLLLISSIYNLYPEYEEVLNYWKWSENYGWSSAINWIKNNTLPNSVLLTRPSSYFAWYTERHVAYLGVGYNLQPTDKLTERELIELIKIYKANYLVIDGRTAWSYPFISSLLKNPHEFLGAKVIFNNGKVVIYNVSNIAYNVPHLLTSITLDEVESLKQWYANVEYGNATLQLDSENKINGNFSIKYVQTVTNTALPQSCLFLRLSKSTNLSSYDYLVFYIKTLQESKITVALIIDSYNYFLSPKYTIVGSNFTQVNVPIKILKSIGNPNLENISRIQICFTDLVLGRTYTNWIDGPLIAEKVAYELINH